MPRGWEPEAKAPADAHAGLGQYEFAGVYNIGDEWNFNLVDRASGKSSWVKLGHGRPGIEVVGYEPASDTLIVMVDGLRSMLPLRRAPDNAAPARTAAGPGHAQPEETRQPGRTAAITADQPGEPPAPLHVRGPGEAPAGAEPATRLAAAAGHGQAEPATGSATDPIALAGGDPRIIAARMFGIP